MECFSFRMHSAPPAERAAAWRDANRRFFGDLRVDMVGDDPADARLDAYPVGRLLMYQIAAPAHRVSRERGAVLPSDAFYKLVLQLAGEARIAHQGGDVVLRPGDWSLYDPRVPYSITSAGLTRLMVVQIPRDDLRGLPVPHLHTCEAATPAQAGLYAVLAGVLRSLSDQLPTLPAASATAVSDAILTLLGSTLTHGGAPAGQRAHADVMKARIKQFIAAHLQDPDLGVERIARDLRCSKRYLHRVFEDEESSIERTIWNARLERCHDALSRAGRNGPSISEVAFAAGFNSSAHFSRLFRGRYGVSPSELRRAA